MPEKNVILSFRHFYFFLIPFLRLFKGEILSLKLCFSQVT
jgi:hypothetical protein